MKRKKDRLHRVIVIGATPAGVAATNKLGELGIPVTFVDTDYDMDSKLSRDEWRLASGLPLNYANRSGLLRILSNPGIHTILPARVTSLRHTPQGFRARVEQQQTYIDPERCTMCGKCAEICPVTTPDGVKPISLNGRRSLPGRPVIDKRRQPFCQSTCPLGVNAQAYIALSRSGRFKEALDIVRKDNVLPGICGRVCTHPCEGECRRGELDEPVAIKDIKRFLADYERSNPGDFLPPDVEKRPERIAVIGSGPAGLAAAADLARFGYQVTVFEKESMAGGLLRYGIGPYRLPRDILDYELEYIRGLGVQIKTSRPVDLSEELGALKRDFEAVVLATGAWCDRALGVPGEDLEGVQGCISFLSRLYQEKGGKMKSLVREDEKVAVIGDGPAAVDLARALKRLGANVSILSWFPEDILPAEEQEVREAKEEGITVVDKTQVVSFSGKNGRFDRLTCRPTVPGEPDAQGVPWPVIVPGSDTFDLTFDRVVVAIGQEGPFRGEGSVAGVHMTGAGFVQVDDSLKTSIPAVYAGGDVASGPSSVVEAMAGGRNAARSIHMAISGEEIPAKHGSRPEDREFPEIPAEIPSLARPTMPEMQPATRAGNFSEVALGFSEAQVLFETERCLQCGICSECLVCVEACGPVKAIRHEERSEEIIVQSGVVIIADPEAAPTVKGEDVIRAYGPKIAKPDANDMITRGFAAASRAMILLEEAPLRLRGRGVSFALPGPELSPEVRLGIFVCRCNDVFGWSEGMDEFVNCLTMDDEVVHSEVLNSACVPEGSAHILRTIREKGITRMVLASCVCCPLDFVCSACTDQRGRLKDALFHGTGVSRSMVETCNLRGEVLPLLKHDESMALKHFTGLIERSIHRARRLKALPTPARTYNFSTAVIGDSEAAVNSAHTLALTGLEVFMFHTPDGPLPEMLSHPNIHCFERSLIRGIGGTLGDFQVFVESDELPQAFQVGSIILGEKARKTVLYNSLGDQPGSTVPSSMQKRGIPGIPFLYPGTTPLAGLFLASPPGARVSERKKGMAAAVLAAAIMPRGPRQSKGYTVVVDEDLCRGCGRCFNVCLYHAISFHRNDVGGWHAAVDEALCKGCGNCISVCPSNAADSPYRDQVYLEQLIEEVIA